MSNVTFVPSSSSHATRFAFGAAAGLVLVALVLHVSTWVRRGAIDFAAAGNMLVLHVRAPMSSGSRHHARHSKLVELSNRHAALVLLVPVIALAGCSTYAASRYVAPADTGQALRAYHGKAT